MGLQLGYYENVLLVCLDVYPFHPGVFLLEHYCNVVLRITFCGCLIPVIFSLTDHQNVY